MIAATSAVCTDPVILNQWHPVAAVDEITTFAAQQTLLLGEQLSYIKAEDGNVLVWRGHRRAAAAGRCGGSETEVAVKTIERFGYVWCSLGDPPEDLFDIPEVHEPDRRSLSSGSIMVATSAPRAVENFLDLGHFPYVHAGVLGIEPHTEVNEYQVDVTPSEILATRCEFFQPMAAASSIGGQISQYTYRVPHPYCVMLYKTSPLDPARRDVIALFVQAMTEETVRAHNFLSVLDEENSDTVLRGFQQLIFAQDKPILENQFPKRLPLDPRAETPIRADKSSIAYRRWLTDMGVQYAVLAPDRG